MFEIASWFITNYCKIRLLRKTKIQTMQFRKPIIYLVALVSVLVTLQTCKTYYFRSDYQDANKLLHSTENIKTKPFLKAHLKNGDICILKDTWQVDTIGNYVSGNGSRYDFNRNRITEGDLSVSIDSVAIFETNTKLLVKETGRLAALSILAGVDIIFGIICITTPKACFGSCPTFYINENDDFHFADAEGFSNAISPSMEYDDIDALNNKFIDGNTFSITMKNEALETHCVKDVKILAYPLKNNQERVYQTSGNDFYLCENQYRLSRAKTKETDVTQLLKNQDRQEWFPPADGKNLSSKEEIYLNFEDVKQPDSLGLILNFRQSMMTTYFIYSAMGYMGDQVGDIFARTETNKNTHNKIKTGIKKELGNIDVYTWNEQTNDWQFQGGFYETGPIAINKQFIPLQKVHAGQNLKIKLVLNKGLWRIDYAALTNIKQPVSPVEISPCAVYNKGNIDKIALNEIISSDKFLISMPGSEYKFKFTLPEKNTRYELFLYSKGYYLEWMREHWIKDKNLLKLKQMVNNPKKYLRKEANYYKQYELQMEQEFWNSKIDTKHFTYNEN